MVKNHKIKRAVIIAAMKVIIKINRKLINSYRRLGIDETVEVEIYRAADYTSVGRHIIPRRNRGTP